MVCNINIIYGNLKSEKLTRLCPETSTKLYVHEFSFKNALTVIIDPYGFIVLLHLLGYNYSIKNFGC
jgi:hypothetical protein